MATPFTGISGKGVLEATLAQLVQLVLLVPLMQRDYPCLGGASVD